MRKAVDPPGEARTDWEPLCDVARALGAHGFDFDSAESIWEEVRSVWPAGRGITYARLEHGGIQWPCPDESHPGTTLLHTREFTSGPRAMLRAIEPREPPERVSPAHPFVLVTGRSLYQFNAGTMTMRTKNRELRATDQLDMCEADARRLGLREGARVRVRSQHGQAVLPLHVDARVAPGEVFATFHDPETTLNALIGPHRDNLTNTPDYKVTAVAIERA